VDRSTLEGRTVLVTGGSRGIGAAVARRVAEAGAGVAIAYRQAEPQARAVIDEARTLGRHAEAYQADVAQRSEVDRLVGSVVAAFGRIDGLVNNAGIMPLSPFLETSDDEWESVIRTNLFAERGRPVSSGR
jgi:3-oxoacyl-[acyl-carrier protein] reductase